MLSQNDARQRRFRLCGPCAWGVVPLAHSSVGSTEGAAFTASPPRRSTGTPASRGPPDFARGGHHGPHARRPPFDRRRRTRRWAARPRPPRGSGGQGGDACAGVARGIGTRHGAHRLRWFRRLRQLRRGPRRRCPRQGFLRPRRRAAGQARPRSGGRGLHHGVRRPGCPAGGQRHRRQPAGGDDQGHEGARVSLRDGPRRHAARRHHGAEVPVAGHAHRAQAHAAARRPPGARRRWQGAERAAHRRPRARPPAQSQSPRRGGARFEGGAAPPARHDGAAARPAGRLRVGQGLQRRLPAQPVGLRRQRRAPGADAAPALPHRRRRAGAGAARQPAVHQPGHGGVPRPRPDAGGIRADPVRGRVPRPRGRHRPPGVPAGFGGGAGPAHRLRQEARRPRRRPGQGPPGQGREPVHGNRHRGSARLGARAVLVEGGDRRQLPAPARSGAAPRRRRCPPRGRRQPQSVLHGRGRRTCPRQGRRKADRRRDAAGHGADAAEGDPGRRRAFDPVHPRRRRRQLRRRRELPGAPSGGKRRGGEFPPRDDQRRRVRARRRRRPGPAFAAVADVRAGGAVPPGRRRARRHPRGPAPHAGPPRRGPADHARRGTGHDHHPARRAGPHRGDDHGVPKRTRHRSRAARQPRVGGRPGRSRTGSGPVEGSADRGRRRRQRRRRPRHPCPGRVGGPRRAWPRVGAGDRRRSFRVAPRRPHRRHGPRAGQDRRRVRSRGQRGHRLHPLLRGVGPGHRRRAGHRVHAQPRHRCVAAVELPRRHSRRRHGRGAGGGVGGDHFSRAAGGAGGGGRRRRAAPGACRRRRGPGSDPAGQHRRGCGRPGAADA